MNEFLRAEHKCEINSQVKWAPLCAPDVLRPPWPLELSTENINYTLEKIKSNP